MDTITFPYDFYALWNLGFGSFTAAVFLIRTRASAPPLSALDEGLLMSASLVQFLIGFVCFFLHGARVGEDHALIVLVVGIPLIVGLVVWRIHRSTRGGDSSRTEPHSSSPA